MGNFISIDSREPFIFATKPLPLHELKNKKIAFNAVGVFKVYLKIMASFELENTDDDTQNTIFMAKYPIRLVEAGSFNDDILIQQQNTFVEFGIPNNLNLSGNLTNTPISVIEPYFQGYRAWDKITITNTSIASDGFFQKTIVGGSGFSPQFQGYKIVAGNAVKIERGMIHIPGVGYIFSYAPIEINAGMSIEVASPLNYPQNTLPPVSHQEVMWFCDRSYLTNRVLRPATPEEESPAEAPTNKLLSAYPNPAHERVTIVYQLAQTSDVEIYLTNAMGQRVATMAQVKAQAEGKHEVLFDTSRLPKGLYLYTLQTANYKETKRLVIK
jgi:hypothetical protein